MTVIWFILKILFFIMVFALLLWVLIEWQIQNGDEGDHYYDD